VVHAAVAVAIFPMSRSRVVPMLIVGGERRFLLFEY